MSPVEGDYSAEELSVNNAEFSALIKQLNVKSLVCGEKEARLTLQFRPDEDIIDRLNRLMKADSEVKVIVTR